MHDSAARALRGGRERRVSLRKPVVVRRDSRPAYRHSGGLLDGPIGFPKARPSLPPGERAVRVRTETLPPEPPGRQRRALGERFELGPGDLRMDPATESAVGGGDDPLLADDVG